MNIDISVTEREEHSLILSSGANGVLRHLNHPQSLPHNVEFTQHVIAPLGEVISLEFYNVNLSETSCDIEVCDIENAYDISCFIKKGKEMGCV